MPEAVSFTFKCSVCGKKHTSKYKEKAEQAALGCEQNHDIVYVPLLRSQVQNLVQFIFTGELKLIDKKLLKLLRDYC